MVTKIQPQKIKVINFGVEATLKVTWLCFLTARCYLKLTKQIITSTKA